MGLRPQDYIPTYRGLENNFPKDTDAYLIGFSGGRDSLMLLDLAVRLHPDKTIIPFYQYLIPGLDSTEELTRWVQGRYRLKLYTCLHWATVEYLRRGTFRVMPDPEQPKMELKDVERQLRSELDVLWIGYGYKSVDSLQRRGMMHSWPSGICQKRLVFAPLKDCSGEQVRVYCDTNRLPVLHEWSSKRSSGIDLSPQCMRWMREKYAEDYGRVLRVFPLAASQADRAVVIDGVAR